MRITTRASERGRLYVMPNPGVTTMQHRLTLPSGVCPYSKNPVSGYVEVDYSPDRWVLEVVALHAYIQWCAGGKDGAPMSVEDIAVRAREDISVALEVAVKIRVVARVLPGNQRIVVQA